MVFSYCARWLRRLRRFGNSARGSRATFGRQSSFPPILEILEARDLPSAGFLNLAFGTGGKTLVDFGLGNQALLATTVVKTTTQSCSAAPSMAGSSAVPSTLLSRS